MNKTKEVEWKQILKDKLLGEQLSSVEFVQDYVQLHFDGPCFTLFIWPEVSCSNIIGLWGDNLYRNLLCGLISKEITKIIIKENDYLMIIFDEHISYIRINLDPDNPDIITEIGYFSDNDNNSWIFF